MRLKWQLMAVLCLLTALSSRCGAQTLKTTPLTAQPVRQVNPALTSHGKLDLLLTKASSPRATQTEVEQAVDGIFKITGADPALIGMASIKNQIVASELAFHNQHHAAITEDRIVTAVNNISIAWNLPNYTRTSSSEVRKEHNALVLVFPQFLLSSKGGRLKTQPARKTFANVEMSPLEATLMFAMLAHQKLYNPEYQMTPEEYKAVTATRRTDAPEPTLVDRHKEVYAALGSVGSLSRLPELFAQADKTMSDLGISGGVR